MHVNQRQSKMAHLSPGRICWYRGNILDPPDSHSSSGKCTESTLGTWSWCFGTSSTSSTKLDVKSGDAHLAASCGDILSSQHGGIWRGFVTIGLDFHST